MQSLISRLLLLGVVPILCLVAKGDTISSVYVSLGPVPGVSSSYGGYTTNAQSGVQNGGTTTGSAGPTQFSTVTTITNADLNFDTDFNNWKSVANPLAPYDNEFGTIAFYSVVLKAAPGVNGIALDDISYTENSTDAGDYFTYACSFGSSACGNTDYSSDAVGVLANGTKVTSGAGTQDVNEIIITGVGLGFYLNGCGGSCYSGTPQQQLNEAVAAENSQLGNYSIQTCFSDRSDGLNSCGSVNVLAATTPEPTTFEFLGFGCVLALPFARRLRHRTV